MEIEMNYEGHDITFSKVRINGEVFYNPFEVEQAVKNLIELNAQLIKEKSLIRMGLNEILELPDVRSDESKSIARKYLERT